MKISPEIEDVLKKIENNKIIHKILPFCDLVKNILTENKLKDSDFKIFCDPNDPFKVRVLFLRKKNKSLKKIENLVMENCYIKISKVPVLFEYGSDFSE